MALSNSSVVQIVKTAASEMGLNEPTSAFQAATELTGRQLGALYNATGEMLVKRRWWRNLLREHSFQTVDQQSEYPLPADFARPISQTEWDRTNLWPMIGPETPQQWQWLKSGILSSGPRERFRLVGNSIEIWPVPDSGTTPFPCDLSFYYISKWWAQTDVGQPKAKATQDNDTCIFDDRLMISGIKLRFFQAKGFDTTAYAAEFQSNLDDALAQDSGAPILSLARAPQFPLITIYNIPDGNWSA